MNNIYKNNSLQKLINNNSLLENKYFEYDNISILNRDEYDSIYFNASDYNEIKNRVFIVLNTKLNMFNLAFPTENKDVASKNFKLNKILKDSIKCDLENLKIYEIKEKYILNFTEVGVQNFKDIKEEVITINSKYKYLFDFDSKFFLVKNIDNKSNFIVSKEHIKFDDKVDDYKIKLNRKHRIILGDVDLKNSHIILLPYPNINCDHNSILKRLLNRILKIYVGKVNIGLIAKRTYQSDESFNLVRISSDIMKLLGIKDTDFVKITYLNTSCYTRVLPIDNDAKIREQNNENGAMPIFEFENIVCIPASIRYELGIPSVKTNCAVKVERDMRYIFKKNINQQILPIILILFSTEIFVNGRELIIKIIIALISLPITMYFNLSNERSICK